MWIIKILLVISAIVIRADNDIENDGYNYDRPEAIPAELAFYLNIPAGHDAAPYIARTEGNFNQHQEFNGGNFGANQGHSHFNHQHLHLPEVVTQGIAENHGFSLNYNQHQFDDLLNRYVPPTSGPNLQFSQENSGFRPINSPYQKQNLPFIQENTGLRLINPHHHQEQNFGYNHQFSNHHHHQNTIGGPQQHPQFQVEPRHLNQDSQIPIDYHQDQTSFQFPQNQNSQIPSQELQPPPSSNTRNPSASSTHHQHSDPNHRFMASISNSYNAPLPFPFGAVPIKFDPLPLKTHLLQERLLPISSYEAKVFYKK